MATNHQCSNWYLFISFIGQAPLPLRRPPLTTTNAPRMDADGSDINCSIFGGHVTYSKVAVVA
jgi:hypothetical protein